MLLTGTKSVSGPPPQKSIPAPQSTTANLTTSYLENLFQEGISANSDFARFLLLCMEECIFREQFPAPEDIQRYHLSKPPTSLSNEFIGFLQSRENCVAAYKTLLFVLGNRYEHTGCFSEAAKYYQKACNVGCEKSAQAATTMYLRGLGICDETTEHAKQLLSLIPEQDPQGPLAKARLQEITTKAVVFHLTIPQSLLQPVFDFYQGNLARKIEKNLAKAKEMFTSISGLPADITDKDLIKILDYLMDNPHQQEFFLAIDNAKGTEGSLCATRASLFELIKLPTYAHQYYKRAADCGDSQALHRLGELHYQGNTSMDIRQDTFSAKRYFQAAAEKGNYESMFQLAKIYLASTLHKKTDGEKIIALLAKAADNEHIEAAGLLGKLYQEGANGIEKDLKLAAPYLLMAAEGGHRNSIVLIARQFHEFALEQATPALLYQLGKALIYNNANKTDQDIAFAIDYLRIAVDKKEADSAFHLARALLQSPIKNKAIGEELLKLLTGLADNINEHFTNATLALGKFYRDGDKELEITKDSALAEKYFKQLADQGHVDAQGLLGKLYLSQCKSKFQLSTTTKARFDIPTLKKGLLATDKEFKNLFANAVMYLKKAVGEQSSSNANDAAYALAKLYPVTDPKHQHYLELAVSTAHFPPASYRLGLLQVSRKEPDKAIPYFDTALKGSERIRSKSAFELGRIYESRIEFIAITEKTRAANAENKKRAIENYELAANLHHVGAQQALNKLQPVHRLTQEQQNKLEKKLWYEL